VVKMLEDKPADVTHRSTRDLASGWACRRRRWAASGRRSGSSRGWPTRSTSPRTRCSSTRSATWSGSTCPPEQAVVLCVDEKTGIQALDRTQPILPMRPGQVERRTHDYVRNGITDLFAALNLATGQVIHQVRPQHRAAEFKKFLEAIDRAVPARLDVHVVLDNSSTHKTPDINRWVLAHPRFTFHFTPTSSSWLNLVERWFAELTRRLLQRSAHKSVKALTADLNTWIAHWNEDPKPFVWHKTADEILDNLKTYMSRISDAGHTRS
jgi:transposase